MLGVWLLTKSGSHDRWRMRRIYPRNAKNAPQLSRLSMAGGHLASFLISFHPVDA